MRAARKMVLASSSVYPRFLSEDRAFRSMLIRAAGLTSSFRLSAAHWKIALTGASLLSLMVLAFNPLERRSAFHSTRPSAPTRRTSSWPRKFDNSFMTRRQVYSVFLFGFFSASHPSMIASNFRGPSSVGGPKKPLQRVELPSCPTRRRSDLGRSAVAPERPRELIACDRQLAQQALFHL